MKKAKLILPIAMLMLAVTLVTLVSAAVDTTFAGVVTGGNYTSATPRLPQRQQPACFRTVHLPATAKPCQGHLLEPGITTIPFTPDLRQHGEPPGRKGQRPDRGRGSARILQDPAEQYCDWDQVSLYLALYL